MDAVAPVEAKDRFTSLDTRAIAREISTYAPAWVDRVFDAGPGGVSFAMRSPRAGRSELVVVPGVYAALLPGAREHADTLTPVARELRRLLGSAQLIGAGARPGDRVLDLHLERADEPESPWLVSIELFGTGNLLAVRGGTIRFVLHTRRYASRTLQLGASYEPPPARRDPFSLPADDLQHLLEESRVDRVSTLAARAGLGGPVAEELLARLGAPGSVPAATDARAVASAVGAALRELVDEVERGPRGFLYEIGGAMVDVTPFRSHRWRGVGGASETGFSTFSEAAGRYFEPRRIVPSADSVVDSERRRRLEAQREQQKSAIAALTAESDRLKEEADWIYAHYAEVEQALESDRTARPQLRHRSVVVEGRDIDLAAASDPTAAANARYEERQRLRTKIQGAREALAETEHKLRSPGARQGPASASEGEGKVPVRRKLHWFERFRWFLSSEGILVLAGRDAPSNDLVVRRYLKEKDIYVHADVHGAASVIVKWPSDGRSPPTELTLREAGQWAICHSKIWRAELASGSAYWVQADQVSKTPETGEFVARGAWVIRGTKHPMNDLPTEIGIGSLAYEGEPRWVAAPPSALRAGGSLKAVLLPDDERYRNDRERELSRELGVSRDLLQSLLPAGGFHVRRT
jgi:predicted ribosome quality control (RQC) complex YloA/Tae2 family protein